MQYLDAISKMTEMISVHFQDKPFNITIIQVYTPTANAEEAEVEWFYEDLQDLLELIPKKHVLFIIGGWNTKLGSEDIPGLTGKFCLGNKRRTLSFLSLIPNTVFRTLLLTTMATPFLLRHSCPQ